MFSKSICIVSSHRNSLKYTIHAGDFLLITRSASCWLNLALEISTNIWVSTSCKQLIVDAILFFTYSSTEMSVVNDIFAENQQIQYAAMNALIHTFKSSFLLPYPYHKQINLGLYGMVGIFHVHSRFQVTSEGWNLR